MDNDDDDVHEVKDDDDDDDDYNSCASIAAQICIVGGSLRCVVLHQDT